MGKSHEIQTFTIDQTLPVQANRLEGCSTGAKAMEFDETIKELTRLWQELLGIESISSNENYFDLGGDSILAVHLFAEITQIFNIKLPVATLYEASTIEALARKIQEGAPQAKWSSLVPIQPNGSRPPFFCMHGAGGHVLNYRDLAVYLGADQPFYGLQAQGLDGLRPPLKTIEEMAALYIKEIQELQPRGPYLIGGYCGGGTIALEVAQQLRKKGEEIALLALFDTMNWSRIPPPTFWSKGYRAWQRFAFHVALFFRMDARGRTKFITDESNAFRWRGMLLGRMDRPYFPGIYDSDILEQIWRANESALNKYVPTSYEGVITDFRSIKHYRMYEQADAKWDRIALGGQEIVVLPVYPGAMLAEPFVRQLAMALRNYLDKAMLKFGTQ